MKKVIIATAFLTAFSSLSPDPARSETWGELDCMVVTEFVAWMTQEGYPDEVRARIHLLEGDRDKLMLALRGVDYSAWERVAPSLNTIGVDNVGDPSPEEVSIVNRMLALLRDRCE